MGLGVVGFLMTTQVNLEGGYFRVHKLNSSHGRVRKEKQREREATDLRKNTSLNYLLHFVRVPLSQPPEAGKQ